MSSHLFLHMNKSFYSFSQICQYEQNQFLHPLLASFLPFSVGLIYPLAFCSIIHYGRLHWILSPLSLLYLTTLTSSETQSNFSLLTHSVTICRWKLEILSWQPREEECWKTEVFCKEGVLYYHRALSNKGLKEYLWAFVGDAQGQIAAFKEASIASSSRDQLV